MKKYSLWTGRFIMQQNMYWYCLEFAWLYMFSPMCLHESVNTWRWLSVLVMGLNFDWVRNIWKSELYNNSYIVYVLYELPKKNFRPILGNSGKSIPVGTDQALWSLQLKKLYLTEPLMRPKGLFNLK